jgi:hypothetical protein
MADTTPSAPRPVHIRRLQRFARDRGHASFADVAQSEDRVGASGILLTNKSGNKAGLVFAVLTDGRDKIQLVIPPSCEGTTPAKIQQFTRGTRVTIAGVPFLCGRDTSTAVPSLYVLRIDDSVAPAPVKFDEKGLQREVTPRLVIGKLMSVVCGIFDDLSYRRYESRFITSTFSDLDTEPLLVRFPGRGADLSLEVSPLPQLLYAAVMTGERRLYSPTRLFSRAYRDGYTSADSPIIGAVEVDLDASGPSKTLAQLTKEVVARINNAPLGDLPVDSVADGEIVEIGDGKPNSTQVAAIRIRSRSVAKPLPSDYAYDTRQRIEVETQSGHVIIEGHDGRIADAIDYKWLCVHVERLATGDFWRIRARPGPETGNSS